MTVSAVSTVFVDIVHQDVQKALKLKYPDISHVQRTKTASVNGVTYKNGMIVACGSTGSLPDFAEVVKMVVVEGSLSAWCSCGSVFVGRLLDWMPPNGDT